MPDLSPQRHKFADLQTGLNPLTENVSLCACHETLFELLPSMSLCHKRQDWNQLQMQMWSAVCIQAAQQKHVQGLQPAAYPARRKRLLAHSGAGPAG